MNCTLSVAESSAAALGGVGGLCLKTENHIIIV